jgi:hypothetical protein
MISNDFPLLRKRKVKFLPRTLKYAWALIVEIYKFYAFEFQDLNLTAL